MFTDADLANYRAWKEATVEINMDHPNQDTDPENDGTNSDYDTQCTECGCDITTPGRDLCNFCFEAFHGPDNDKDLDPERSGGYTFEVSAFIDAGKPC